MRRGRCFVSIDLDKEDVTGISAVAQHVEPDQPGLLPTSFSVLARRGQKGGKLFGDDRDVHVDHKQAVRHESTLFFPRADLHAASVQGLRGALATKWSAPDVAGIVGGTVGADLVVIAGALALR
jgi:hypothetical protein